MASISSTSSPCSTAPLQGMSVYRHDYGETRINCAGEINGRVFVVTITWRALSAASFTRGRPMTERREISCVCRPLKRKP